MKLFIAGDAIATAPSGVSPLLGEYFRVEEQAWRILRSIRGANSAATKLTDDAPPDQIVELEYENGVKQWVRLDQLAEDLQGRASSRGSVSDNELQIPTEFAPSKCTEMRGALGWVLKGLKLINIDLVGPAADWTAAKVIRHFEDKLKPGPGLYRMTDPNTLGEKIEDARAFDPNRPILIFIHGTASTTDGSFGKLAGTAEWEKMQHFYGKSICALQHRSLSESPLKNALDLARLLPQGQRLHLVTHSRGGLVAECLNLLPLNATSRTLFKKSKGDKETLDALNSTLDALGSTLEEKKFQLERFVRVACPARGTLLASGRLDRYLSLMVNVVGLIPGLQASATYDFLTATLLAVVKKKAELKELPGLEAQMPESPLIALLNSPGRSSDADLAVIAGDVEGSGLLGRLQILATDLFYREDHDLVVNTASMSGGVGRKRGPWRFFDRSPDVNHFNYFANDRTRERIANWLLRPVNGQPDASFQEIIYERIGRVSVTPSGRDATDRPTVILLPGFMGSQLSFRDRIVWADLASLATGGFGDLKFHGDERQVRQEGLLAAGYERIAKYLGQQFHVIPFAYDWRLSVERSALRLAEVISEQLEKSRLPVRLLAHSMGGLVARALAAKAPDLWKKFKDRGGRLVQLGTPNRGSYAVPRLLLGVDGAVRRLALVDIQHQLEEFQTWMSGFPGLLEMMPEDGAKPAEGEHEFFSVDWWNQWSEKTRPSAELLAAARRVRSETLGAVVDPDRIVYVAGYGIATPWKPIKVAERIHWQQTTDGDGVVPLGLGELNGVRTYYVPAAHGDLADHEAAFEGIAELLEKGETSLLSSKLPHPNNHLELPLLQDDEPLLYPTEEELMRSALGSQAHLRRDSGAGGTLQMWITHGDLREAKFPVIVGHYEGDSLYSAERALDRQLGGRLERQLDLGLYPGGEGSAAAFHDPDAKPPGAIVIGLGEVGEMSAEKIRRAVCCGVLAYALKLLEPLRDDQSAASRREGVSAVLLGTNGGRALGPIEAVSAIGNGVLDANALLQGNALHSRIFIDRLEIIELYEDAALEAQRALVWFGESAPARSAHNIGVVADPTLRTCPAAGRHRPYNHYRTGWWRRILISDREGRDPSMIDLQFEVLTDRARVEDHKQIGQRRIVEDFLNLARHSSEYRDSVASTLFELLIPPELKPRFMIEAGHLFILDKESARYPWEMLAHRTNAGIVPLADRFGLLRQFKDGSQPRKVTREPRGYEALVIGDPISHLPSLRGAEAEAREVAEVLTREKKISIKSGPLLRSSATEIITALFAVDYRIVHIAAHGEVFDARGKENAPCACSSAKAQLTNGVVIGEHRHLTAAEIRALTVAPDLVFLNCCRLGDLAVTAAGQSDRRELKFEPVEFASSIALQLIDAGVKVVVVAGWAVDDEAARSFARRFYEHLLRGESLGESVRFAREEARHLHPHTNTWAAYQVYGNPEFRLELPGDSSAGPKATYQTPYDKYFGRAEVITELQSLATQARWGNARPEIEEATRILRRISTRFLDEWGDGEVLEALGRAWAAYEYLEEAISAFTEALQHSGGRATIGALEGLIDAEIRLIQKLQKSVDGGPNSPLEPRASEGAEKRIQYLVENVNESLDLLGRFGRSPDRLAKAGSLQKRLALKATGELRKNALEKAMVYYGDAYTMAKRQQSHVDPYPGLNWLTYRLLLRRDLDRSFFDDLKAMEPEVDERFLQGHSFWDAVGISDLLLLKFLLPCAFDSEQIQAFFGGLTPPKEADIRESYERALRRGATPQNRGIIVDHFDFLSKMLADSKKEDLTDALKRLAREVSPNL